MARDAKIVLLSCERQEPKNYLHYSPKNTPKFSPGIKTGLKNNFDYSGNLQACYGGKRMGLVFSRHNDLYVLLIRNLTINRYGERYRY